MFYWKIHNLMKTRVLIWWKMLRKFFSFYYLFWLKSLRDKTQTKFFVFRFSLVLFSFLLCFNFLWLCYRLYSRCFSFFLFSLTSCFSSDWLCFFCFIFFLLSFLGSYIFGFFFLRFLLSCFSSSYFVEFNYPGL